MVLGAAVLGGAFGLVVSLVQTPVYTSATQLFVSTTSSATTSEVFQGSEFSQARVASYAQLLSGNELAGRVADHLGSGLDAKAVADEITATPVPDTVLLDVSVTDPSPRRAQEIARAVGIEFPRLVAQLEAPDANGTSPVKVTVTQAPQLPTSPSSPQTIRNVVVGIAAGLLLGILAAIARSRLDRTIRDPELAVELGGAPVIGTIVRDEDLAVRHTIEKKSLARAAEDYRQLRTNLQFLDVDNPPRVIMVSSPMPSEGKTTVVINLALALAEAGRQVTIVEADLRRPRVTRYLGMVSGVGLTNILAGAVEIPEVLQSYGAAGMYVIGAGPTPPNPGQLLASAHMADLIEELRKKNDYVLIDAPPLLPVADATGLAVMADGVLLSIRFGKSRKEQLRQAAETLDRVGARTLGSILNIVPPKAEAAGAYGYGYTYDSADDSGRGSHRREV